MRKAEATTCQVCKHDKGKGCWTRHYGKRIFVCPTCYDELKGMAEKQPYSALADKLALRILGYYANRKFAKR